MLLTLDFISFVSTVDRVTASKKKKLGQLGKCTHTVATAISIRCGGSGDDLAWEGYKARNNVLLLSVRLVSNA